MGSVKKERVYSQTVLDAARLLGSQVRQGRLARHWTVQDLAERAGISKNTLVKVEHGDPSVAFGTALDLAVLVGVPLFYDDRVRLSAESRLAQAQTALIAQRVRPSRDAPDYDF